jgi:hypothetical protein
MIASVVAVAQEVAVPEDDPDLVISRLVAAHLPPVMVEEVAVTVVTEDLAVLRRTIEVLKMSQKMLIKLSAYYKP